MLIMEVDASLLQRITTNDPTLCELNFSPSCKNLDNLSFKRIAKGLRANHTVTLLNLQKENFNDDSIKRLARSLRQNGFLSEFLLDGNCISNAGAKYLAKMLLVNTSLKKLSLSDNKIQNEGISFLSDALRTNKTLCELNLSGNLLDSLSAITVGEMLTVNQTLLILLLGSLPQAFGEEGVSYLAKVLGMNNTLKAISFDHNDLTDAVIPALKVILTKKMKALITLNLSHNQITTRGAKTLAALLLERTRAIKIDLDDNDYIDDDVLTQIEKITDSKKSIKQIKNNDARLTELDWHFWDESISFHSTCVYLMKALSQNSHLKILNLSGLHMGEETVKHIAKMLISNMTILTLGLQGNEIRNAGAIALAEMLKINSSLLSLDLSSNPIGDLGRSALMYGLRENTTLLKCKIDLVYEERGYNSNGKWALLDGKRLRNAVKTPTFISKSQLEKINKYCNRNYTLARLGDKRRVEWLYILLMLVRGITTQTPSSGLLQLPFEVILHILNFLDFKEIHKTPAQVITCTEFLFNNIYSINEKLKTKQGLRIMEKITVTYSPQKVSSTFRFFKDSRENNKNSSTMEEEKGLQSSYINFY